MPLYNRLIEKGKEEDKNPGTALNKLKEVGSTAASLVGIDPESDTLIQDLGYETVDMFAHQSKNPGLGGLATYVGAQAVQHIPFVKMGRKYVSNQLDNWLRPIFKTNDLAVEGIGNLDNNPNVMQSKGGGYVPKGGADPSGISSQLRYGDRQIWENLPTKTQELFTELGVDSDKAVLLIKNSDGPISREALAAVEGGAFTDATFKFMSSELLPEFLEESKHIDLRGGIQLDHIAQLRAMIPFYEGRNLKQWPKIRRILVREGIFGGHNPKNLQYLNTPVHQIKTNFWIDQVGKDGSKFFEGRRLETYAQVEAAAKDMKTIINRSNNIVEKLSAQYKLLNQGRDITPVELAAILEKVDLNFGKYNLKDFKKLVRLVNKQELDADTLKLMKGVELQGELDDYSGAVRQVIQDTDPADLPKKPRVTKKDKGKKIEDIVPLTEEQQLNILDEFFDE